jgi:predicted phage-related endonuclease
MFYTNEISTKIREFKELQIFIKQLEEEADGLKAGIIAKMEAQQTDTLQTDLFTVKYTAYTSSRVDTTSLRKELPEIAARYTTTTEARRFSVA